jgi:hypothetical protein
VCDHAATGCLGDGVRDDSASAQELAALRAAVLRDHEQVVRMGPKPRSLRVTRRLKRLHLSWLLIPWYVVLAAGFFLAGSWRRLAADEEQTVGLYRRLSGKDPGVARAEVWRISGQLGALDERLRDLEGARPGAPGGADQVELEAAAGALVGYYLAGRRTDDALLGEVEAAWAEYEELLEQEVARAMERRLSRRRPDPMLEERAQVAADRYRAAWRRWLDRRAERGSTIGPGAR